MTVSDWLKNCHESMEARHLKDQNFTSVNEHGTLDGVVYFFLFEFKKLLTHRSRKTNISFVVNMYHIQRIQLFS